MATQNFKTKLEIILTPTVGLTPPLVSVCVDKNIILDTEIIAEKTIVYTSNLSTGNHYLKIKLYNKDETDSTQLIKISQLKINGISDQRFIWNAFYYPLYPKVWAKEQNEKGIQLKQKLNNIDCLGWNGEWVLHFTSPVFTWIHQVCNFGWIYD